MRKLADAASPGPFALRLDATTGEPSGSSWRSAAKCYQRVALGGVPAKRNNRDPTASCVGGRLAGPAGTPSLRGAGRTEDSGAVNLDSHMGSA